MRSEAVILAATLVMAPLGARGADLVVWCEEEFYPQENEAVAEIIAAFEQDSGKQVELVFHPYDDLPAKVLAALARIIYDALRGIGLWARVRVAPVTRAVGV